jgi:vacuole morphology and inheritance protein 14
MMYVVFGQKMQASIPEILPALLKTLSDEADEVILFNLQVLARISLDEAQFERVLDALVQLFMEDRRLLESRGSLIIRKLCVLLDSSSIYIRLAAVLNEKSDLEFVSIMVQSLNLILLTATELAPLRLVLKGAFQADAAPNDKKVFDDLFACWSHSPVSTFSLCLLAQAYDLSSALIDRFAEVDVTVSAGV